MALATIASSILLQQGTGAPDGLHDVFEEGKRFPHIDESDVCWIPQGYSPDVDYEENTEWKEYEDRTSEIMRAECKWQDYLKVCSITLYWEPVECNIYEVKVVEVVEEEVDDESGWLPWWVVYPVFGLSGIWKSLLIGSVFLPWWSILASVAAVDFILDFVFLWTLGLFCTPCAGFFIWLLNIALIPFTIWGWLQRLFLEIFAFPIDGWMIFLGGSGCFLSFGKDCLIFDEYLALGNLRKALDIQWFMSDEGFDSLKSIFTIPTIEKASDVLTIRNSNRAILAPLPIISTMAAAFEPVLESLLDF